MVDSAPDGVVGGPSDAMACTLVGGDAEGALIRVEAVRKVYGEETVAVDDVTLTIDRGTWATIMGPSGSGKTTLLNIIGCLDSSTGGRVTLCGTDVTALDQGELTTFRRESIGLIFQQYHLVPYLTALENVMMAQYFHSMVDEAQAAEALERVGLGHRLHHLPAQLSGGEQQRVCIARALINEPDILLADEPTGNLDQANGRKVLELIGKLREEGHTVVMVTHNPEVAELGDRTIEMVDGRVVRDTKRREG
jgi:putative ABC transport system ATP-binding protein